MAAKSLKLVERLHHCARKPSIKDHFYFQVLERQQHRETEVEIVNQEQHQISTKAGFVDHSLLEPASVKYIQEQAIDTEVSDQNEVQIRLSLNGGLGNQTEHSENLGEAQGLSDLTMDSHIESNRANDSNKGGDILDVVDKGIVFEEAGANVVNSDGNASCQLERLIITDQCDGFVTFVRVKQEEMDASSSPFQNEYKAYIDCIFGGAIEISDAQEEQGNGELSQQQQVTKFQMM